MKLKRSIHFSSLILFLNACGADQKKENPKENTPPESNNVVNPTSVHKDIHTVLVVDNGFDLTHEVFKSKIKKSYTLKCIESSSDENAELTKESFIASLKKDSTCTLVEGINDPIDPKFNNFSDEDRKNWNNAVFSRQITSQLHAKFSPVIDGSDDYLYHGTGTAGIIAYKNPNVSLVLVKITLGTSSDVANGLDCPDITKVKKNTELLGDAEVQSVYKNLDVKSIEKQLNQIIVDNNVKLINYSAGGFDYKTLQKIYVEKVGCDVEEINTFVTEMKKIHKLENQLDAEQFKLQSQKGQIPAKLSEAIVIQAAGNEGAKIDSGEDTEECITDPNTGKKDSILIGAIDYQKKKSSFSNYGNCIDAVSLGTAVIAPAPRNFYTVVDGTSFSAPLVVRYLTMSLPLATTAAQFESAIKGKEVAWLDELAYKNSLGTSLHFMNQVMHLNNKFPLW